MACVGTRVQVPSAPPKEKQRFDTIVLDLFFFAYREFFPYIMLDEENNTVVFVYTMGYLDYIEEYSQQYNVTPTKLHFWDCNFSIYGSCEDNYDYTSNEHFENCTYDISFLDYLK